jgi:hypothetical protein
MKPLRRIVQELLPAPDLFSRRKVKLECGHTVWASSGAIYRARCRHCPDKPTPGHDKRS